MIEEGTFTMRPRRLLLALVSVCGGGGAVAYWRSDSAQRRKATVRTKGVVRFCRSVYIGMRISADYWWTGYGLEEVRGMEILVWRWDIGMEILIWRWDIGMEILV